MKFTKTNFVEKAASELGVSVGEYLKNADFNYVIFYKGKVDAWEDGSPVIYGDEMGVIAEIQQSNGLDENGNLTADWNVMTEWDFICNYCLDCFNRLTLCGSKSFNILFLCRNEFMKRRIKESYSNRASFKSLIELFKIFLLERKEFIKSCFYLFFIFLYIFNMGRIMEFLLLEAFEYVY